MFIICSHRSPQRNPPVEQNDGDENSAEIGVQKGEAVDEEVSQSIFSET